MSDPGGQPPSKRYQLQKCRKLIRGGRGSEIQKSLNYPMGGGGQDSPLGSTRIHHHFSAGSTTGIDKDLLLGSNTGIYQYQQLKSIRSHLPDPPVGSNRIHQHFFTWIHHWNPPGSTTWIHQDPLLVSTTMNHDPPVSKTEIYQDPPSGCTSVPKGSTRILYLDL